MPEVPHDRKFSNLRKIEVFHEKRRSLHLQMQLTTRAIALPQTPIAFFLLDKPKFISGG
ncbi:MAG TPA: hypothetical protein V6C91_19110 [Coleofasciculaceae cyanobacterium]